ncbi:MAG TPA: DUF1028 domain-containing protein [Gammaproteobacteria bacterium]|nr:DUF1028 domain-containing protein [Gammaproteobacteria bacterium]
MTFSIVARCERTGQCGVAGATAMIAVGKLASHAAPLHGAIATQAELNPYIGYDGLRLLARCLDADEVLRQVLADDPDPEVRQVGVVDGNGRTAAWTGSRTLPWAGHAFGRGFSVQGNRLAGPEVLEAVIESMHGSEHLPLAERLLLAIEAGDALGGDRLGERSSNIFVVDREEYPLWDIRVDDHDHPIRELRRLFHLFGEKLLPEIEKMPKRATAPRK